MEEGIRRSKLKNRVKREGRLNLVKLLLFCRLPSLQQPSLLTGPTSLQSGQRWFRTHDCSTSLHRCTFTLGNQTRCLQLWGWGQVPGAPGVEMTGFGAWFQIS